MSRVGLVHHQPHRGRAHPIGGGEHVEGRVRAGDLAIGDQARDQRGHPQLGEIVVADHAVALRPVRELGVGATHARGLLADLRLLARRIGCGHQLRSGGDRGRGRRRVCAGRPRGRRRARRGPCGSPRRRWRPRGRDGGRWRDRACGDVLRGLCVAAMGGTLGQRIARASAHGDLSFVHGRDGLHVRRSDHESIHARRTSWPQRYCAAWPRVGSAHAARPRNAPYSRRTTFIPRADALQRGLNGQEATIPSLMRIRTWSAAVVDSVSGPISYIVAVPGRATCHGQTRGMWRTGL